MRLFCTILSVITILQCAYAPPVTPDKKDQDSEVVDDLAEYTEYHRYLKEVVQALESDPDFRERLEKADEEDVRSGKIAEHLDFVNHNVRTRLDEIKRRELERLRHLATKHYELTNDLNFEGKVPSNEHLDHRNPHTFEIDDLKKLIKKTTADLEIADKKRRDNFKEYEMEKEFEKHQKLEKLDEVQKKEFEEKQKKEEEAKKHHQPLRHPVTRDQLLEIWKGADHMDNDFDPKVFFMMHDVDGNGVWDPEEVKALFIKELDKLYTPGGPNKDMHERAEEMERMREHVFTENDKNRDGLIDFNEFMLETQRADFNQDEGWKPIDENQIYTQQEYEAYERRRLEELHYLQQRGLVDAHGRPIPGAQQQIQQAYQQQQQQQQGYHPGQPQYVPGQPPQHPAQLAQPHYQGQPQGQYQAQPQGQYQGQPQGQYQGQPQAQYQGQPQGQYQGQPQGQYQGQPQGQPQYPGQPQAQQQYQQQYQGQPQAQQPGQPQLQPVQNQQPNINVAPAQPAQTNQNQPGQQQPLVQAQPQLNQQTKPQDNAQGQVPAAQNEPNAH
ncbi:nucleobindin-2 isoform X2 [Bicyclus anynana]|uniref:Nucleobindin-2 isoform X2 n=1 Tax=Bicyclus anynana TaxID=110368 RepID=A0A6J1N6T0_BICAN|nr:nucleobindin-2 isoform X2 [Bicyclus anynana]